MFEKIEIYFSPQKLFKKKINNTLKSTKKLVSSKRKKNSHKDYYDSIKKPVRDHRS
jgi:hypothetical protein